MTGESRGHFKVEFYTLLPQIRKMYENGNVVVKIVYDELFAAGKITMSYHRFADYFRKEITKKYSNTTPDNDQQISPKKETSTIMENNISKTITTETDTTDEESGPLIFSTGTQKDKKRFNPHANGIDPKKIL